MVYNPYQQYSYPVYYPQPVTPVNQIQTQPQTPVQTNTSPLILDTVSGKTSAEIYNVDMGKQAILIDIDNPVIYKKSRSMENKLEMEQYDLVLHVDEPKEETPKIDLDEYVKKEAVEQMIQKEVDKRISEISFTPKTSSTRKKTSED